jgi:hypothetical protein
MSKKDDDLGEIGAFLRGLTLTHRKYRPYAKNPTWDHDHCEFCGAEFSLQETPDVLKEGYATDDDYHWVCGDCFRRFRGRFDWKVTEMMT